MATERDLIYLAALLHDIGKFFQRGDETPQKALSRPDLSTFCPPNGYGGHSHKHVLWTARFLEEHPALFAQNKAVFADSDTFAQFFRAAVAHHKPDSADLLQRIVQQADHYASGLDRTTSEGMKDEYEETNKERTGKWDDFRRVRMTSVFEPLLKNQTLSHRLPVSEMALDTSFFPKKSFSEDAPAQYATLWKQFESEVAGLPRQSFGSLADSLLYLLEKYTVTVPGSTQHLPDVSLYDHLKSTAALALCLHDFLEERNGLSRLDLSADDQPLLLIGGDLSGIQAYLYDIIGKNAAKNLKGRSFYLQLLVDSIVQRLIDGLDLYRANIVYSSGGGFYLLAPNTAQTRNRLETLRREIGDKLRAEQGVKLYLALDTEPVSQGQIFGKTIHDAWGNLAKKLSVRKRNRFAEFMATGAGYAHFFEPSEVGGESRGNRDAITGEEFEKGETRYRLEPDDPDSPVVKAATFSQVRLGRTLREQVQVQVTTRQPVGYWEEGHQYLRQRTGAHFNPLGLGYHTYFLNREVLEKKRSLLKGSVDEATILAVNSTQLAEHRLPGNRQTQGFTFYGGNDMPRADDDERGAGQVTYFEDLAGGEDVSLKRLGILRMDVDNLGHIFKEGFSDAQRTFSRYAALSRSLDYFFKGYLNQIWASDPAFKSSTFILYAGGDDLFIVGKWNHVLRMARQIQQDFAEWTCHNPRLGLSGGMALVPPRFPIAKAAAQSEGEEKRAKNHEWTMNGETIGKNAFSFLGTPLHWQHELPLVEKLKDALIRHIGEDKDMPKALLGKIGSLHGMKQEQEKKGLNPSWRWMAAYDLGRAADRTKSSEAKAFFKQLQTDLFLNTSYEGKNLVGKYSFLDLLHVAARWAELEMRS